MKCHFGVDAGSGLVYTITVMAANAHDAPANRSGDMPGSPFPSAMGQPTTKGIAAVF